MATASLDTCDICMETYDDTLRPRSLNCGHSFCTTCLNNFIKNNILVCPMCKQSYPATSGQDFPINYGMEAMISNFKKAQLDATPPQQSGSGTLPSQSESVNSKLQTFFTEHKAGLKNLVHANEEILLHLLQYEEFLLERKAKHEEAFFMIYDLAYRNEEMVKQIDTEHKKLVEIMREGDEIKNVAIGNIASLDTATSTESIITASDELDKCYATLEAWNENCQKPLPDVKTIRCSEKIMRDTTAALKMVTTEGEEAATETLDFSNSSLPVMDKLNRIRGKDTLRVMSLQNMSDSLRNLVEKGHVYAVQEREGRLRSAKVTLKDKKTYLHYLQDGEPPDYAHTIQLSDLTGTLKTDSIVAFMDLAWEGSTQGRVHFLLSPNTPYARHFRILCTGELGPSYAQSRFFRVANKGDARRECLIGGDYEHNDGSGGAPLITGLNRNVDIYKRKWVEGMLYAESTETDGPKSAQFVMITGTGTGVLFCGFFGQVQHGIGVLKAAVKRVNVRDVTIVDCGVMLPF